MKRVAIVGSTGSIGRNSLDIVSRLPEDFSIVGLTAFSNVGLLKEQVRRFAPSAIAVKDDYVGEVKAITNGKIEVLGQEGFNRVAALPQADIVVIAISGSAALFPLLSAVRAGKAIALANKEALVMAGGIIIAEANKFGARLIPIDSEQSAIFQCLAGRERKEIDKIYLTASGGPFAALPKRDFSRITLKEVLRHPRWKMGKKITVDSATMMNKGLEIIEAQWLFEVAVKDIEVLVHKEAAVHSMVKFIDGSIIAQLGVTDMRLPIQFALTYPKRIASRLPDLDLARLGKLTFARPDLKKFPSLGLARQVAEKGGSLPAVMNAANEEAVGAFLNGRISFKDIYPTVEKVVARHKTANQPALDAILSADKWARQEACRLINA